MRARSALVAAVAGAAALLAPVVVAPAASAHGWVTSPPSRQDHCATGATSFDCGQIRYEPHSVEAPKGSLRCSGGNARFGILDDESLPWPRTQVGSTVTMRWELTAQHATSTWEYFVDGVLHRTFADGGARPDAVVEHTLENLPAGEHTILARWNVADTANAFYACVDVTVGPGDGGGGGDDGGGTTDPDLCDAAAWDPSATYLAGDHVTHEGHAYEASWWTRGDDPATTGEWGAWDDLGAC